mgnify:CR=1 FL=1
MDKGEGEKTICSLTELHMCKQIKVRGSTNSGGHYNLVDKDKIVSFIDTEFEIKPRRQIRNYNIIMRRRTLALFIKFNKINNLNLSLKNLMMLSILLVFV